MVVDVGSDLGSESWRRIASMGSFVEIEKRDALANEGLPTGKFAKSTTFAAVYLEHVGQLKSRRVGKMLKKIMAWEKKWKPRPQIPLHCNP